MILLGFDETTKEKLKIQKALYIVKDDNILGKLTILNKLNVLNQKFKN